MKIDLSKLKLNRFYWVKLKPYINHAEDCVVPGWEPMQLNVHRDRFGERAFIRVGVIYQFPEKEIEAVGPIIQQYSKKTIRPVANPPREICEERLSRLRDEISNLGWKSRIVRRKEKIYLKIDWESTYQFPGNSDQWNTLRRMMSVWFPYAEHTSGSCSGNCTYRMNPPRTKFY